MLKNDHNMVGSEDIHNLYNQSSPHINAPNKANFVMLIRNTVDLVRNSSPRRVITNRNERLRVQYLLIALPRAVRVKLAQVLTKIHEDENTSKANRPIRRAISLKTLISEGRVFFLWLFIA